MMRIDNDARARYRELQAVLRQHVDPPACDLLAALMLDSEGWTAWRSELKKLRKERLAAVRYLKQYLATEPVLGPRARATIAPIVSLLSRPTKKERLISSRQAASGERNNVVAALALHLAKPKHKTRFWSAFICALKVLYPETFWNGAPAARMAAARGEEFLAEYGPRSATALMLEQGRPSILSLGHLPKLSVEEHVSRIVWLRDQLAK